MIRLKDTYVRSKLQPTQSAEESDIKSNEPVSKISRISSKDQDSTPRLAFRTLINVN